jgi:hypothetical protein
VIPTLSFFSAASLKLAGAGLIIVLVGLFFWLAFRAGASRAMRRIAEKASEHARQALDVDERVHSASDRELERLYDESLD